ncbi:putative AC transposase [Bienertia sinuspersici]
MEEAHNSFNIKSRLVSCCKNFHLVDKLFSISLDNATTNTSAMQFLKEDPSIKLVLDGSLMHVRCCAHILNLCVQDGLDELRTLLELIRNVIRWIRAARSAKRILKQKCEEYGLRKKVIALDTPTRWNSTYKSLHDAITYRDVLTDMYNESLAGEWAPDIHIVILECIKIICTIKQISLANPGATVKRLLDNMKVKWCAYFTEFPPIYDIAAILDPGVKLEDVQFDVPYYVNNCKRILERLCEDYGAVIQPQPIRSSMGASRFGILGSVLKNHDLMGQENFHIIQWWKNHSSKFLVFARIAKDSPAIPASTIASNSTFSAGRRVLDEKKNSSFFRKHWNVYM